MSRCALGAVLTLLVGCGGSGTGSGVAGGSGGGAGATAGTGGVAGGVTGGGAAGSAGEGGSGGGSSGDGSGGGGSSGDGSGGAGGGGGTATTGGSGGTATGGTTGHGLLPIVNVADPDAADRGRALFEETSVGPLKLPLLGLRNLWFVQPALNNSSDEAYWDSFQAHYGLYEAPFDNDGYPLGIRVQGSNALIDCLACHAGEVAGRVVIGAANTRFDMQGLYDDMAALAALGGMSPPLNLEDATGAAGANDAWGLGIQLAHVYHPPPAGSTLNTTFGYQRPAAWWTLKYKSKMYSDGSANAEGHRTMMAMLLAYGLTVQDLATLEFNFEDLKHYLWSLEAPPWPFAAPDPAAVARGKAVYLATCASCHGEYGGPTASFPNLVISATIVGTDGARADNFGPAEVAHLNGFLAGTFATQHPMQSTGGYVAQPLIGIWARAPYFHNGSVPTLAGVVNSSTRPAVWERTGGGASDYDPAAVGWSYTVPSTVPGMDTLAGRRVYDTARPGLSNGGHTYGDPLTANERADLLEYLKTL